MRRYHLGRRLIKSRSERRRLRRRVLVRHLFGNGLFFARRDLVWNFSWIVHGGSYRLRTSAGDFRCILDSLTAGFRQGAVAIRTGKRSPAILSVAGQTLISALDAGMEAMSDTVGPDDLVLCVNAAPNHVTGQPVPLVAGETYRVLAVLDYACPCGRSDALLDVGVDFAWCQTRFRLLPKPKAQTKGRRISAPKEKETV